jgi:tetratricopeptide (TPR) repeat protein
MKNLINELHRRSLWQVLGIYLAGAWIALQVVDVVNQNFGLPDWVAPFALILLVIGLPIVLATAFVQEGMSDRGKGEASRASVTEEPVGAAEPALAAPDARTGAHHRLFTWRNAVRAGVGALALLGVATIGWMVMRTTGIGPAGTLVARGVIEDGERVILADFENHTPDSLLADVVTETFRVDLAQSPTVSLADEAYLREVLDRMERPSGTRLDAELAREVAIRDGIKAVIRGDIGMAGSSYVLSARLIIAETGEELVPIRETAEDQSEVVKAIDRLSKAMRERLGESLRSLAANEPLEQVTTGSLEALLKYSQAQQVLWRGEGSVKAIPLLEEALAIDSTFAMAWRRLSTLTAIGGARQTEAAVKAYEYRDRLTERERYHTVGIYEWYANRDFQRSATAYLTLLDTYPDDPLAWFNLAVAYQWQGEFERMVEAYNQAAELDYTGVAAHVRALTGLYNLGRTDEARIALTAFVEARAGHPATAVADWAWAMRESDFDTARLAASRNLDHANPSWSTLSRWGLTLLEASQGHLAAAQEAADSRRNISRFNRELDIADRWDLPARRDTALARQRIEEALVHAPVDSLSLGQKRDLVFLFARTGQPARARSLLDQIAPSLDSAQQYFGWFPHKRRLEGNVLVAEGRYDEAIAAYRAFETERGPICGDRCALWQLAEVYDLASRRDSAIATYTRLVEEPMYNRAFWMDFVPTYYRRLGELHDEAGNLEKAAEYYARFVEMWATADEELQPQVRAAQARLEEIVRERG